MKKVKNLIEVIKTGLAGSLKTKIIAGIAGVAIAGGVAGGSYYWYTKTHNNSLPTVSREQVEKDKEKQEEVKKTEEEKTYDDKVLKFNELIKSIKDLDSEFNPEEVSKENVDSLIDKYTKVKSELDQKEKEEIAKNEEKKDTQSTGGGSPNTGGSNNGGSSNTGGSNNPPVVDDKPVIDDKPVVNNPTPPPAPSIPSGWKDDVAAYVVSYGSTPGITNVPTYVTQDSLNFVNGAVNGWLNGSGATINSINAESLSGHAVNGKMYLKLYTLKSITVKGLDKDSIARAAMNSSNSPGQVDFYWCKVYYDSATDTSTIYISDGFLDI